MGRCNRPHSVMVISRPIGPPIHAAPPRTDSIFSLKRITWHRTRRNWYVTSLFCREALPGWETPGEVGAGQITGSEIARLAVFPSGTALPRHLHLAGCHSPHSERLYPGAQSRAHAEQPRYAWGTGDPAREGCRDSAAEGPGSGSCPVRGESNTGCVGRGEDGGLVHGLL